MALGFSEVSPNSSDEITQNRYLFRELFRTQHKHHFEKSSYSDISRLLRHVQIISKISFRLHLIRHAEGTHNPAHVISILDPPLTPKGIEQSEAVSVFSL
jgi:hypothetical protein